MYFYEVFRGAIKILNEMEPEKSDAEILCIEKIQERLKSLFEDEDV